MKNYKSSIHRLAHLFKEGRNLWKNRALERQQIIRALMVKVRDLSKSRDKWKQRAGAAEYELRQIKKAKSNQ